MPSTIQVSSEKRFGFEEVGAFGMILFDLNAFLSKFTLSEQGTITKLTFSGYSNGGLTINAKPIIYSDNAGVPDALLAVGSPIALDGDQEWRESAISVVLPTGTYWLGFVCDTVEPIECMIYDEDLNYTIGATTRGSATYTNPNDYVQSQSDGYASSVYATYYEGNGALTIQGINTIQF